MSINIDPFISQYNEDTLKYASIGRPMQSSHVLPHPEPATSVLQNISNARNIFDQSDIMGIDFIKYGLKGAGLAVFFLVGRIPFRQYSQLTLRKISKQVLENNFGRLNTYYHMFIPDILGGAILGMAYHGYFHVLAKDKEGDDILLNRLVGGAIFGTAAISTLVRPSLWWAGLYGGAMLGMASYSWAYANMANTRGTVGSVVLVPGLSDEQRERQARKDHIHALSLELPIKYNTIQDL